MQDGKTCEICLPVFSWQLEGKHLLLVDDVLTTGATVVSCADAFRGIPGLRISVLTLALAGGILITTTIF